MNSRDDNRGGATTEKNRHANSLALNCGSVRSWYLQRQCYPRSSGRAEPPRITGEGQRWHKITVRTTVRPSGLPAFGDKPGCKSRVVHEGGVEHQHERPIPKPR
jgi:hypothetical protein